MRKLSRKLPAQRSWGFARLLDEVLNGADLEDEEGNALLAIRERAD